MNKNRLILTVTVLLILLGLPGNVEGAVDVRSVEGFKEKAGRCIMAPMSCGRGVNCVKAERQFIKRVQKIMRVGPPTDIKDVLFERSVREPTRDEILEIAGELGYDSVLFAGVVSSDKDYDPFWGANTVSGSTRLTLVTVGGDLLVEGTASTEFSWTSGRQHQLVRKQLINILQRAEKQGR